MSYHTGCVQRSPNWDSQHGRDTDHLGSCTGLVMSRWSPRRKGWKRITAYVPRRTSQTREWTELVKLTEEGLKLKIRETDLKWGGSKGVINFPWIFFYAMRSLVPAWHFRNISGHLFTWLVCGSFHWRHGLLFTDCIVRDDKDKVIGFKRSHWIHLGWWRTGSPKLQLFQLSQLSLVTNCWFISSSAYFPWNIRHMI